MQAAFTNVTANVIAITPQIRAGRTGIATLLLSNTGNIPATGPLLVTMSSASAQLFVGTVTLRSLRTRRMIRVRIKIPTDQTPGTLTASASSTWQGTSQTQAGGVQFRII